MSSILIKRDDMDLSVNSKVDSVTIYSDRAEVKRAMRVRATAGESEVVFSNLGTGIDEQSIRASVSRQEVRIVSTSHERNHLYFYKEEEDEKTYGRILDVLKRICTLTDERSVLALENRTLNDIFAYIKSLLNSLMLTQENSIPRLREALDYCNSLMNDNVVRLLETRSDFERLDEELSLLKEMLERIRTLDAREQNNIRVVLDADADSDVDITIVYTLSGASWKTTYDVLADTVENAVELSCFGEIRQSTGETWTGVRVSLSTAMTGNEMNIPLVYPVYLSGYSEKRSKDLVVEEKIRKTLSGEGDSLGEEPADEPSPGEAKIEEERTTAGQRGTSYVFEIKEPLDLPSDDRWHRGLIARARIPVQFSYETVPERAEFVFLKSRFRNPFKYPLLPGKSFVYRNSSYMGTAALKHIASGEELDVSFGVDEDLRIRRIVFADLARPAKGLSNRNVREWEFHYILYNYKSKLERVRLCEGIYVSELKEVEVKVLDDTTAGNSCDADGIMNWELELQPDPFDHKKIVLHYTISAPKDFDLTIL